jgi:hypothetical protein
VIGTAPIFITPQAFSGNFPRHCVDAALRRWPIKEMIMGMKRAVGALTLLSMLYSGTAFAGATIEEAKALADKAAAHMREVGPEKAFADFNDPKGGYIDRDLFVWVYTTDGKIVCIPGIPVLLGKDAKTLKDVDGKEFGKEVLAIAAKDGDGSLDLRMTNPVTKRIEPKRSYLHKVGNYIVGVGAYNP